MNKNELVEALSALSEDVNVNVDVKDDEKEISEKEMQEIAKEFKKYTDIKEKAKTKGKIVTAEQETETNNEVEEDSTLVDVWVKNDLGEVFFNAKPTEKCLRLKKETYYPWEG